MFNEISLGIATPKAEPESLDEMRQAIDRAGQGSYVIRSTMDAARYRGLSGEDTYVTLAYYALRELERHYRLNMKWLNTHPMPAHIFADDSGINTREDHG